MKSEKRLIFTNLNFKNWENLILFGIFLFYIIQLGFLIGEGAFPIQYGEDFLPLERWKVAKMVILNL